MLLPDMEQEGSGVLTSGETPPAKPGVSRLWGGVLPNGATHAHAPGAAGPSFTPAARRPRSRDSNPLPWLSLGSRAPLPSRDPGRLTLCPAQAELLVPRSQGGCKEATLASIIPSCRKRVSDPGPRRRLWPACSSSRPPALCPRFLRRPLRPSRGWMSGSALSAHHELRSGAGYCLSPGQLAFSPSVRTEHHYVPGTEDTAGTTWPPFSRKAPAFCSSAT